MLVTRLALFGLLVIRLGASADGQIEVDVRLALEAAQYESAEATARGYYARVSSTSSAAPIVLARASDLLVEAALKNGHGSDPELLDIAERAVKTKEAAYGRSHREVATSLALAGAALYEAGKFNLALPIQERALSIIATQTGERSASCADRLDAVARTLIELQQFERAGQFLTTSLQIREQFADVDPPALARTLEIYGRRYRELGRYPESISAIDRALTIWSSATRSRTDPIDAMIARGELHFIQGELEPASNVLLDAYKRAQGLRPNHPQVSRLGLARALVEFGLGNIDAARRLNEDAMRIGEESLAPCNPARFDQSNELANVRRSLGDYESAATLYQRQLADISRCLGSANIKAAIPLYNLFELRAEMGSRVEAERFATKAIGIWTKSLGPTHPFVASGLAGYASFLNTGQRYREARVALERAISIRQRAFGPRHPAVAELLAELARTISALGDSKSAADRADESIAILRGSTAWSPNSLTSALAIRARIDQRTGNYQSARAFSNEGLALSERLFGPDGISTTAARIDLATADAALRSTDSALTGALIGDQSGRKLLQFNMRSLPERRALELAEARPRGLDLALSVGVEAEHSSSVDTSAIFDALIRSRGLILDELAARARATLVKEGEADPLAQLNSARARYATLVARGAKGESVDTGVLETARTAKEEAEATAASQSAATRSDLARARLGLVDVRSALPPGAALVAFARYERTTFRQHGDRRFLRRTSSYVAVVLHSQDERIKLVSLGAASKIDQAIADWRSAIVIGDSGGQASDAEQQYRLSGTRVRRLLWDPLAGFIAGASRVFIVPDGAINTVSFAALPVDERSFLVERGPELHYLSTERDLVPSDDPRTGEGILAVGGADYGPRKNASNVDGCADALLRFEPLPATAVEAREIARLTHATPASVLTGAAATKTAILRSASGRRVVHLATHGFFFNGGCTVADVGRRGVGGLVRPVRQKAGANPLMLSGLAVAGANHAGRSSDALAGLLTSEDVLSLNLAGTEWVVLSACDTGLGEIKSGEGVFGLRRAFQIAGARTVIMSLWSVEDVSTAAWMQALYDARFQQHLSTADAIRAASLRTLNERRRRGESTHPFYWAGFVAAGDWR